MNPIKAIASFYNDEREAILKKMRKWHALDFFAQFGKVFAIYSLSVLAFIFLVLFGAAIVAEPQEAARLALQFIIMAVIGGALWLILRPLAQRRLERYDLELDMLRVHERAALKAHFEESRKAEPYDHETNGL